MDIQTICTHTKTSPLIQISDGYERSICYECNKIYKINAHNKFIIKIDDDPNVIDMYLKRSTSNNNSIIRSHKLEEPTLQCKDYYRRSICRTCKKVYKEHVESGEISIDNNEHTNSMYFGKNNELFSYCTYNQSGRVYQLQYYVFCYDCFPQGSKLGACLSCIETCHKNHNLSEIKHGNFFCDCGANDHQRVIN
jgi:hypothetical protein